MIDLATLAREAGFAEVIEGDLASCHTDPDGREHTYVALTSCGIKPEGEEYPAPVPVNTPDAIARYKTAFMAWSADQPKAALIVREWPILHGWHNGKRAIYSRLAAR